MIEMRDDSRILVIGSAALADAARRALPERDVIGVAHSLAGVWQTGRAGCGDVLLSLSLGGDALRALRSLRRVAPGARIVLTCTPADEPRARQALGDGADEYLVEPLAAADLRQAFDKNAPPRGTGMRQGEPTPTVAEIVQLGDILRNLAEGPQVTLDRLAALVQHSFDSSGVAIELDGLEARAGDVSEAVLEMPIEREHAAVGRVRLGRCRRGTYLATTAARLADMCRLVEAAVHEARERDQLRELAWTDDLSQLRNRRYFSQVLDDLLAQARQRRTRVTVLLFDVDGFKAYNDAYGHATGDALIRELGVLLNRCSRADDIVARYGGDEFTVAFWDAEQPRVPGSRHPSEPIMLAERFQRAIREHQFECFGPDAPGPVTISGGLACFPWHGDTRDELMRAADAALGEAKRTGKNRIALAGDPDEAAPA